MLLVHLPLNKLDNFYNQGLADVTVTNNGATYNTNGKIGGCYTFGDGTSSNQYKGISINTNFSLIGESRSICAWVRPKGNHLHYSGAIVSSGNWNSSCWGFCLKLDNTGFTGFDSGYNIYYYTDIPINNWTHLCVTVLNGVTKFYKNGLYLGELSRGSGSVSSDASNTMIGRETYAGGHFSFNGDISDVRIYSHALSPKEVHDLSKGLVLHYPFNDEYVESTTYDCSGYCNNGTINGTLTVSSDTARYLKSSRFGAYQSPYIEINPTFVPSISNGTVSWWFKPTTSGNHLLLTGQNVNYWIAAGSNSKNLYHYNVGSPVLYVDGIRGNSTYKDGWHHYCLVGVDFSIWTKMYINNYGGTFPVNGLVSDFRIYSTALSEEDVKELYNTSAIINNNNTLEAYEFAEGTTYNINKSGVMTGTEFTEHNEEVLINNTEQIFATEFTEI